MASASSPPVSATQRRGLAALALAILLASLGVSIVTVALPALARDFSAPAGQLQWVVLAYLLSVTVAILAAGRLGDLVGNRTIFLAGLGVFTMAAAACAVAPTPDALIAARVAQGVGGAILMALPISIIRETVPNERTGAAMGLMGTMSAVGTALGPSFSGLIIAWSEWRWAFLLLATAGAAVWIFAARAIPATQSARSGSWSNLDLPGTLVLALTLTAYSLSMTGMSSGLGTKGGLLLLAAAVGVCVFVVVERQRAMPLVQLAVLRDRALATSLFMNLLVSTVMMSTLFVGPFYLAFSLGLNDAFVGMVMAVGPVAAAVTGVPAGRLTDRFGTQRVLLIGLAQTFVGLLCLALLPGLLGVVGYVVSLMFLTPGFQLFLAANNTSVMMAAPEDQRGMISGLLGLSRNLGFMTGPSVLGAAFWLAAGTEDIAQESPLAVSNACSITFLAAAALAMLAALGAIVGGQTFKSR